MELDYISESMGHAVTDHSITQIYIEHYPLAKQMEYNSKLLDLSSSTNSREELLIKLSKLTDDDLRKIIKEL